MEKLKKNKAERKRMVLCMEYIARQINDEDILDLWLSEGVADGDIEYGNMDINKDEEDLEYYIENRNFPDLMNVFLRCMSAAKKSGGLYCDHVLSGVTAR